MRVVPICFIVSMLAAGQTAAQDAKLTIQPGHTALIQQYVVSEHAPVAKIRVELGTTIPDDIQLRPVPLGLVAKVPEVRNYEYLVADGGKVVFVEPYTRVVVQIVR